MADASHYTRRYWKNSTLLRQLERDGGDEEAIRDCINELAANAMHAPTADVRARSQAAIDAHFAHDVVEAAVPRGF